MKRVIAVSLMLLMLVVAACGAPATEAPAEPTEAPAEPTAAPEPTEEPMMEETIVDIAVADGRFTTLVAALQAADLVGTLSGEGPFTVFAPTDDAFAALPEGTVEGLLADIPALTEVLTYHVAAGKVMAADVVGLTSFTTVQGEEVTVTVEGDAVILNGSVQVIITDIEASNGVIHVIDAVLLPPSLGGEEATDIIAVAEANGSFTTLLAAIDAAGLTETLQGEGPFTVFAPTDDAFAALPEGTVEGLLADIPALTNILTYHVVAGAVPAETVVTLPAATTLQGSDVKITVTDAGVVLNDTVNVIITDVEASNGIIHVLDAVLLPPADIIGVAEANGSFTTLLAAIDAAGLTETLQGEGPFTVFAPTDDAFAALPEGTVEGLLADIPALTNILTYHVVSGKVYAAQVVELSAATTLQGTDITIEVTDSGVVLNGTVNVIITDVIASNGVIHVIDAVLLPAE